MRLVLRRRRRGRAGPSTPGLAAGPSPPGRAAGRASRGGPPSPRRGLHRPLWRPGICRAAVAASAVLGACGGEPPEELGGFDLALTQSQVMEQSGTREGFTCRLRATRPKVTICDGPSAEGPVEVWVQGDSTARITLQKDGVGQEARRAVRRMASDFGRPAWRDRPYPPQSQPPERYHTLWVDEDTTRSVALICRGAELEPPCTVELKPTSPARLLAQLDTLLGIRR